MHGTVPPPGSIVWIRQQRWRVERARRDRDVVRLEVTGRQSRVTFLAPFDRVLRIVPNGAPRRVRRQSGLARLAGALARTTASRSIAPAIDARIEILPFQLEPAIAIRRGATRLLIADAVGLGKTIQAGLIVAEVERLRSGCRTLIVIPPALRAQWADELRDHFLIASHVADADGLARLARSGAREDAIWDRAGVWLASVDFLKQPQVIGAVCRTPWDLVIVDEAHGVCGESQRHAAVSAIGQRARRLVLLSATPHSGDQAAFDRLLALGSVGEETRPAIFRRTRDSLLIPTVRHVRRTLVTLTADEQRVLDLLTEFERAVLSSVSKDAGPSALLLLSVFRKRALSTSEAFNISIDRRLRWLSAAGAPEPGWQQPRLDFEAGDDVTPDECRALTAATGLESDVERSWLRRLREIGRLAAMSESKVGWLARLLSRTREPVAVFTEFRDSLMRVQRTLASTRPCSVIHGGLPAAAQHVELERFLTGATSALLATDVACQGLNLHRRCRWVINLELPWNPVRLEQRAGRVDRLGQPRAVHVGLLVAKHESEIGIAAHLARRTRAVETSLGVDALTVAKALFDTTGSETAESLVTCDRWQRSARAVARSLRRRRCLAARWRIDSTPGRPVAICAKGFPPMRCFSVPIVDRLGSVVERRFVAIAAAEDVTDDRCRTLAASRARSRARRLAALRRAENGLLAGRERAMHEAWRAVHEPGETQSGLFDRRAWRMRESADVALGTIDAALDDELRRLDAESTIDVGQPALAFVVNGERRGQR